MEIKIAICDDESRQAEYIKMLVNKWSEQKFEKVQVTMLLKPFGIKRYYIRWTCVLRQKLKQSYRWQSKHTAYRTQKPHFENPYKTS